MARFGVVNSSTIAQANGTLNPDYLLRIKERITERGAVETPSVVREEINEMKSEAQERMNKSLEARERGNALLQEARDEQNEAEALSNMPSQTLIKKMGM